MRVAVASGKGGTGKTTISLNLAVLLAQKNEKVTYVDCDVEEPNGHLFLHPSIEQSRTVGIPIPVVETTLCDGCGKCGEMCRFSAIVVISGKVLTFPELCKGCGGCSLVCPHKAIQESPQVVGIVETGQADGMAFVAGTLNIGQTSAVPVIREIKRILPRNDYILLDAPPGTSCPVIETVMESDIAMLVTEPTPFGLNGLKLASEMVKQLDIPQVVILNRSGGNNNLIHEFCKNQNIDLIAEIPDDRRIAEAYSRGDIIIDALPEYKTRFSEIIEFIEHKVNHRTSVK